MEFERAFKVNIKELFGEGLSFSYCKDDTFYLNLNHLDDPLKSSSYISKCMTMAGKDKRFVIYRKISELLFCLATKDTRMMTGSKSDGSDIAGSDNDYLCTVDIKVLMDKSEMINIMKLYLSHGECLIADLSSTPPGFTKLFSTSDGRYLPNSCLHQIDPYPDMAKTSQVGPSMQTSTLEGELLGDTVYVMPCSDWPLSHGQRWIHKSRPFGWPPKHVVEDLAKTSCFVVPVGREDSKESHLEWRFAFPFVERGLVWAFNTIQLQCFVLLKVFNNVFLKKIDNVCDGISSFHIKMVMFWECENSDPKDWYKENLCDCVRRCLRRLRLAIRQKELKHFIIEDRNVFATKFKNPETREKVIKKIKYIENDISGFIIHSLSKGELWFLLHEMIHFQHFSKNARTSLDLDFNTMMCNRLAWVDQVNLVRTTVDIMILFNQTTLKLFHETNTSNEMNIIIVLRRIKNDIYMESIPHKIIKRFIRDIHMIASGKVCNKAIEQILLQVFRILNAFIDIQIGSKLFEKATKIQGVYKEKMLLDAERNFKKGVELDEIAGQLYLVTYYLACGIDESAENVLVSLLKQNEILVCFGNMANDAILISDGNIKISSGISQDFMQRGYASNMLFSYNDLELVPDVLKYDLCMTLREQPIIIHPFVYAKYLQIHFSIKSKSELVIQYIAELRQSLIIIFNDPLSRGASNHLNVLAYCYRQIGATNVAIYYFMLSMRCNSNTLICKKSAVFHLAFLLKQFKKKNTKA